ncbi:PREDICTED: PHD finger protein rhinoceros-like, partial [Nicotiana attenuata]|uniref:PHD finger protein rhinoceros-like n=1 Tax=Nicotiana attenuata TaxID=49451 RepID=UPI000905D3DD
MLAKKSVPSGALRKVLNERLKASQKRESPAKESDSSADSESFIFASEGSSEVKNVENRFVLIGPVKDVLLAESSRSGAEGLVHLSKQRDEPGSSAEETLADILKRVGASYDPKKRKSISQKAPTVLKPAKKRKTSPPKSTAPSVPKGRATRSRVRQSEADLQKALEESKRKKTEKGKKKVAESSEATEEEEMELVHQERGTTVEVPSPKPKSEGEEHGSSDTKKIQETPGVGSSEVKNVENRFVLIGPVKDALLAKSSRSGEEEMELVHQERGTTVEVPSPKPKRSKTSTKKSFCEPVSGEPLLAKRTRFAVKVDPGSSLRTPINTKVRALVQESGTKDDKIARLK